MRVLLLLTALPAIVFPLAGQVTTGTIVGTVSDPSGALLPGVVITIKNIDTGFTRARVTDQAGRYTEPQLPIGRYQVEASHPNFTTQVKRNLLLTVATDLVLNFSLEIGSAGETIEVKGEPATVQLTSAEIADLVDQRQLKSLPLNARDIQQLATLQAGVQAVKHHNLGPNIVVSGTRAEHNRFLLNGIDLTFTQPTSPVSAAGVMMGMEAVQEFKLLTNDYGAAYGEKSGGVLNTVTKSGTNVFHGSAYEYLRNDVFDARNFFDQGEVPPFSRHQFGASFGGPIRKTKTFFFGNYERLRHRLNLSNLAVVPSARARQGYLPDKDAPGGEQFVGVAPQVVPYLALIPEPNGADRGDGSAELFSHPLQKIDDSYVSLRLDHEFARNWVSGVYTGDWSTEFTPVQNPNFADHRDYDRQIWSLQNVHTFSPSFLNTSRFGFNNTWFFFRTDTTVPIDPSLYFVPNPFFMPTRVGQFGAIVISGLDGLGLTYTRLGVTPRWQDYRALTLSTDFNKIAGAHSLQIGTSYKPIWDASVIASNLSRGFFFFGSLTRFLEGQPNSFNVYVPGSELRRDWRNHFVGAYVEDTIRARQNLTFTAGLRYDFVHGPGEANGRITNLRGGVFDSAPTVGEPYFRQPRDLLAPRLGLNWDPFSDGKSSLRLGGGVFYEVLTAWNYFALIQGNAPFGRNVTVLDPPFPNALSAIPPTSIPDFVAVEFAPRNPTKYSYNVTAQREIDRNTSLTVSYVGSLNRHLSRRGNENVYYPEVLPDGRLFWPPTDKRPLPNPHFRNIDITRFDAISAYNSFEAGVVRRVSEGLGLNANYTFGKCLDDSSTLYNVTGGGSLTVTGSSLQYIRDHKSSRGRCSFNNEHSMNVAFTYTLPVLKRRVGVLLNGWTISSITTVQSGFPFELATGFNNSRQGIIGTGPDRPDWVPGCDPQSATLGRPDRYFDPNCFVPAAPGFLGNMGSRVLTGPGLIMTDWGVLKTTHLSETRTLEFRAEVFNILNRPNFAAPTFTALFEPDRSRLGSAGRITQTVTTSRQMQFAIRFAF